MRASIVRRIERLETCFEPLNPEFPQVDCSLLVNSELSYFSKMMKVLRLKARTLGYGDGSEGNMHNVGWFDLGNFDPMINDEVKQECFEALNSEERAVIETLREIMGKGLRLTEVLSEDEKSVIRAFNGALRQSGNDLPDLRLRYSQIMEKYGEKVFE